VDICGRDELMPDECRRWSDGAANNGNGKRDELVAIFFRVVSDRPHEAGTRAAQLGLGFGNAASTFTKPAAGTEGNEGRNTFRNPGYSASTLPYRNCSVCRGRESRSDSALRRSIP
jgi:hypothetical protein